MEPIQIVLLLLAAAGVWAVVELALVFRKLRGTVDSLNKTVEEANGVIADLRPTVQKLEGTVDELQPVIADLDPVLVKAGELVDAASADLVEVNVLLRDVSSVTGSVSSASSAVSNVADVATGTVQKLFGKRRPASAEGALEEGDGAPKAMEAPAEDQAETPASEPAAPAAASKSSGYYTYVSVEEGSDE